MTHKFFAALACLSLFATTLSLTGCATTPQQQRYGSPIPVAVTLRP